MFKASAPKKPGKYLLCSTSSMYYSLLAQVRELQELASQGERLLSKSSRITQDAMAVSN
jgi:hypothetical protein